MLVDCRVVIVLVSQLLSCKHSCGLLALFERSQITFRLPRARRHPTALSQPPNLQPVDQVTIFNTDPPAADTTKQPRQQQHDAHPLEEMLGRQPLSQHTRSSTTVHKQRCSSHQCLNSSSRAAAASSAGNTQTSTAPVYADAASPHIKPHRRGVLQGLLGTAAWTSLPPQPAHADPSTLTRQSDNSAGGVSSPHTTCPQGSCTSPAAGTSEAAAAAEASAGGSSATGSCCLQPSAAAAAARDPTINSGCATMQPARQQLAGLIPPRQVRGCGMHSRNRASCVRGVLQLGLQPGNHRLTTRHTYST